MIDELKLIPHDTGAELATLGAMILCDEDRLLFDRIRRGLWPQAFYGTDNALLFSVACEIVDAGRKLDLITLRSELSTRNILEDIGGVGFLAQVVQSVPSAGHGPNYAGIVINRAKERDAIRACNRLVERLTQPRRDDSAADIIQSAASELSQIVNVGRDLSVWKLSEAIDAFIDARMDGKNAIAQATGITALDDLRDGFNGLLTYGGYTLVAARPSMGKSTFLRHLLLGLAKAGTAVGLIAVEENRDKIAGNALSAEAMIQNSHLAYGKWTNDEFGKIGSAAGRLVDIPYHGIDTAFNINDVVTAAETMIVQHGCKIIAIDHIHLIDPGRSKADGREQQISEMSAAVKSLFKRHKVVGVVAAQLNRPPKGSTPEPPHLTDLRASGALEEHADSVIMLHRKDYYYRGRDGYEPDGLAQILIRKNRNGEVGEVVLKADLEHQRFVDIAPSYAPDPFA